jgi:hypothetical protein
MGEGVAARALARMDVTLEDVRDAVEEIVGVGERGPAGSSPFTPRAKRVLELALREGLQLGHNYIGTEHILLGLVREGKGVGAQVLVSLGAGLEETRGIVLTLLQDQTIPGAFTPVSGLPRRTRKSWAVGTRKGLLVGIGCWFCGRQPPDTGRLFTGKGASICEHCVRQWSEQLDDDEGPDHE